MLADLGCRTCKTPVGTVCVCVLCQKQEHLLSSQQEHTLRDKREQLRLTFLSSAGPARQARPDPPRTAHRTPDTRSRPLPPLPSPCAAGNKFRKKLIRRTN